MHVHLAVHKLPKHAIHKGVKIDGWRLGTEVWHSVVGEKNGLCFVGGKNVKGRQRRKPIGRAKMAAYVSKYIMKDYADAEAASNRYSRSNGIPVGKPTVLRFDRTMLADIIGMVFTLGEGDVVVDHSASEEWGRYWLCTEQPKRRAITEVAMIDAAAARAAQIASLVAMKAAACAIG